MPLLNLDNIINPLSNIANEEEIISKDEFNTLNDSVIKLIKELRFNNSHLDFNNMPLVEGAINNIVGDVDGKFSQVIQSQEALAVRVGDNEKGISQLVITAEGISATVEDLRTNVISQIEQSASEIKLMVTDNQSAISKINVSLKGINSTVADLRSGLSSVEQTASSIKSQVRGLENNISSVEQTADRVSAIVSDGRELAGIIIDSRGIDLIADRINLIGITRLTSSDNSRTYVEIDGSSLNFCSGNSVDFEIRYGDGGHIKMIPHSAKIIFDGTVQFDGQISGLYAKFG